MTREQMNAPFAEEEIRTYDKTWTDKQGRERSISLTYIEDETVMDRLDVGYGPGNWQIEVEPIGTNVVKVRLGVHEPAGWVWYEDFGYPNREGGEVLKEAVSDGIRRCGRYVGIARDLYRKSTYEQGGARARTPAAAPADVQSEPDSGQETTRGGETEELIGTLRKAGTVRKGGSGRYQVEPHEAPDGTHSVGFRLEVDGDRAIPQVLIEGPAGEALYVGMAGKTAELVGQRITVKGRLFNVKAEGRKSYYRLRVSEFETPEIRYPADAPFDDTEQSAIDAALEKAGTAA